MPPGDPPVPETTPARAFPRAQPPSAQTNIPATPEALLLPNESQSTTPAGVPVSGLPPGDLPAPEITPTRALPQAQPSGTQTNIPATPEALPLPNESQSTTPAGVPVSGLPPGDPPVPETTPARAFPRAQPPSAQTNIPATPEALLLPNESQSTTPAGVLISSLPPGDLLAPEIVYRTHAP